MAKETRSGDAKVSKRASVDGGKKRKDPNAPKRGRSAYMFFSQEQRSTVKEENPEATFGTYIMGTFFFINYPNI